LAGLIARRTSGKWPLALGMLLTALAAGSLALWNEQPWQIFIAMAVLGAGIGFALASMATLITQAVRPSETGVATGMNTVMRTVGGVVGGQVGAALLTAHTIPGTGGVPSVTGFTIAFAVSAFAATVGAGIAVFVTPPRLRQRERLVVATREAGGWEAFPPLGGRPRRPPGPGGGKWGVRKVPEGRRFDRREARRKHPRLSRRAAFT